MTVNVIENLLKVYQTWYGYRDNIPKKSRYTLGDKIDSRFIQILELLYIASYQNISQKIPTLEKALSGIDTLKFFLRIAWELKVLDDKRYTDISKEMHEIGRQVGGWKKGLDTKTSTKKAEEI